MTFIPFEFKILLAARENRIEFDLDPDENGSTEPDEEVIICRDVSSVIAYLDQVCRREPREEYGQIYTHYLNGQVIVAIDYDSFDFVTVWTNDLNSEFLGECVKVIYGRTPARECRAVH